MRSRYTAYFLSNAKYIIKTTHPENIDYQEDNASWEKEIIEFSKNCTFEKLTILEFIELDPISFVTFRAQINCDGNDQTFREKSSFEKVNNSWKYLQAVNR